jgi:hypothetical protein
MNEKEILKRLCRKKRQEILVTYGIGAEAEAMAFNGGEGGGICILLNRGNGIEFRGQL